MKISAKFWLLFKAILDKMPQSDTSHVVIVVTYFQHAHYDTNLEQLEFKHA